MGKLRAPLSLPLRELTCVQSVRTLLPFVATNSHANRVTSGEGAGGGSDPWDFFPWPKCTAFEDFTATTL